MTPEQIAAGLRKPYVGGFDGICKTAADLIETQAAELATLRAERDALRSAADPVIGLLDGLVAESGRGVDWGEEDAFRRGEWFEDHDLAAIERLRALKGGA